MFRVINSLEDYLLPRKMKKQIKKTINKFTSGYKRHAVRAVARKEAKKIKNSNRKLNMEEKNDIVKYWRRFTSKRVSFVYHELIFQATGIFDPSFLPDDIFQFDILSKIRNSELASAWADKSYLDFFLNGIPIVENIIRNASGRLMDKNFSLISFEEGQKLIDQYGDSLVIKPTMDTNTGKGIQLLHCPIDLKEINEHYKKNYVLQIPLKQCKQMECLNPSSINTIRISTILVNNKVEVLSAFVKVGQAGEFCDNHGSSRYFIGIKKEGNYRDFAIDHDLNRYKKIPSGYQFANQPVPSYELACETVKKAHMMIPHFVFAYWDVCININGIPVIVECNLKHPNTIIAQVVNESPFFGDYIDYIYEITHQ